MSISLRECQHLGRLSLEAKVNTTSFRHLTTKPLNLKSEMIQVLYFLFFSISFLFISEYVRGIEVVYGGVDAVILERQAHQRRLSPQA